MEGAIATYTHLLDRFEDSTLAETQEDIFRTWLNRGITYGTLEQKERELEDYDRVITGGIDSDNEVIANIVSSAMLNKAAVLHSDERFEEALLIQDQLLERFEKNPGFVEARTHSKALANKARTLEKTGRLDEALTLFRSVIRRYNRSDVQEIQKTVANARLLIKAALSESKERAAQTSGVASDDHSARD